MAVMEPSLGPPDLSDAESSEPRSPVPNLAVDLDPEAAARLGRLVKHEVDRYLAETATRRANCQRWRLDFELYPPGPSTRWQNAAAVAAPLTHVYCQSHHVRLSQQIVKSVPPFTVVARTPAALEAAPDIEDALTAILEEAQWQAVADQVHSELPIVGNVFLRVTYEQEVIRRPRFEVNWDEQGTAALLAAGAPPDEALLSGIERDDDGGLRQSLGWENVVISEGIRFRVIPFEDGVILPATIRDPEEARGVGERIMIRGAELRQGADQGIYIKEAVEQVLRHPGDDPGAERGERLQHQGITPDAVHEYGREPDAELYRSYLCYELCWLDDFNDDGELEWSILTLHHPTGTILRCQYLPWEHGRPHYLMFRYYTRARELFGMGVAEKLAGIQDAATAVWNQFIDMGDLSAAMRNNFWYDGTSGFDPDRQVAEIGRPVRVDNVDGIKPMAIQALPAEHYQLYQLFKDAADLVTASSNPSLGRATDTDKTLGEIQIVTGASNQIFEEIASKVARDWAKAWDQVRWLTAQFGEGGEVQYRIAARPGKLMQTAQGPMPAASAFGQMMPAPNGYAFAAIDADLLRSEVDLVPAALRQLGDMQSQMQQASVLLNTVMMNPLTQANMPVQAIVMDLFLQALRVSQREKIMAEIQKSMDAQMAVQQAMLQAGIPPEGAEPGNNPGQQGPRGNPQAHAGPPIGPGQPGNPQATTRPPPPEATTQSRTKLPGES